MVAAAAQPRKGICTSALFQIAADVYYDMGRMTPSTKFYMAVTLKTARKSLFKKVACGYQLVLSNNLNASS
jgi:hypothetical protein